MCHESPENAESLSNLALRVPDKRSGFVRLHFSVPWRPHGLRATLCRLLGRGGSCALPHHVLRPDFGSEPPDAEGKGTGRTPEAAVLVRQSQDTQDGDSNSAPGSRTGVGVRDDPRAEYKSRAFACHTTSRPPCSGASPATIPTAEHAREESVRSDHCTYLPM